jgi:hypothetical protein
MTKYRSEKQGIEDWEILKNGKKHQDSVADVPVLIARC